MVYDPIRCGSLIYYVEPLPQPKEYLISWYKNKVENVLLSEKFVNSNDANTFYDFLRTWVDLKENVILFKNIY